MCVRSLGYELTCCRRWKGCFALFKCIVRCAKPWLCSKAAEASPALVLAWLALLSAREGLTWSPALVLLSSLLYLNLLLWRIPALAATEESNVLKAGCGVKGRGSTSPQGGKQKDSANPRELLVLAGQSLSILVKVLEVSPGYSLVDCLKYQHVASALLLHFPTLLNSRSAFSCWVQ